MARTLQEILLRNIRLPRFSWDWPAGTVLKTQWGAVGKDPELPSSSSGPAVLSLKYLTSSRETKMDLAKASHVRSPKPRHSACSAVTFPNCSTQMADDTSLQVGEPHERGTWGSHRKWTKEDLLFLFVLFLPFSPAQCASV